MDKLPKVYPGKIDKDISHEQKYFRSSNLDVSDSISVSDIDRLLRKHIAGVKLIIGTKDNEYTSTVIGKSDKELLTMENQKILINDIKYIKKASD